LRGLIGGLLVAIGACGGEAIDAKPDAAVADVGGDASGVAVEVAQLPDPPTDVDCNPLVGGHCLSGIPSAVFEMEGVATATGRRLALPAKWMPQPVGGQKLPVDEWKRRDGWSPVMPTVVLLPKAVDAQGLADETKPEFSTKIASPTVMVEVASGARVAHLAEVDLTGEGVQRQALILRPWRPLPAGAEVAVALTTDLRDVDGKPYARTAAMQAVLDGKPTWHPRVDDHAARFDKALKALEKAGLPRAKVLAAWPYQVASQDWTVGPAQAARNIVLALDKDANAAPWPAKVTHVEVAAPFAVDLVAAVTPPDVQHSIATMHPDIALRIRGEFELPLFLNGTGNDATLNWQGEGPGLAQNGTVKRSFLLIVPPSVVQSGMPAPLVVYGHGFLRGACVEGCVTPFEAEFMPRFANALGVVVVGADWWGLSQAELGVAATAATDFANLRKVSDKLVQAALQPLVLGRVARFQLAKHPLLQRAKAGALIDDSKQPGYYGNSLGGIMGTTATALNPDFRRMVLNVPGSVWSLMLTRSSNFHDFLVLVAASYPDPFERQVLYALSQTLWDLTDPVHFAAGVALPVNSPPLNEPRRALWVVAHGDSQVPMLGSGVLARAAGVPLLTPETAPWWSTQTQDAIGFQGMAAFVQWDSKRGTHPPGNAVPWPDNGAHVATRWMPEFQQMVWRVLVGDGQIEQRYCLKGGRDTDGKLPCDLQEEVPKAAKEMPPLPVIPPPSVD
jgi:hypothetical protein